MKNTILINKIRSSKVMTRCNSTRWEFKANGAIFAVIERAENGKYFAHRKNARAEIRTNFMAAVASLLPVYAAELDKETMIDALLTTLDTLEKTAAGLSADEAEAWIIVTPDCSLGYNSGANSSRPVSLIDAPRYVSSEVASLKAAREAERRGICLAAEKLGTAYKKAIDNTAALINTLMN